MNLTTTAKNNLRILIGFFVINGLAIVIAILKGMKTSSIPLLIFVSGQFVGILLFSNIQTQKTIEKNEK